MAGEHSARRAVDNGIAPHQLRVVNFRRECEDYSVVRPGEEAVTVERFVLYVER